MFFFKNKSKENWKQKAKKRRSEIVKLKKRTVEILKSRDEWKAKALKYKDEKISLVKELKKNS